jgi:nitroreductase
LVTTHAMLGAESLGLGSVMIGSGVAIAYDKALCAKYKVPPGHKIGMILAIGYPAVSFRRGVTPLVSTDLC